MIVVDYHSGLDANFRVDSYDGLHVAIRAYLPGEVTLLDLHRGKCKITDIHYSRSEGRWVTIPMDRTLAEQYVAAARDYIHKHHLNDYQWDSVLPRMHAAMQQVQWEEEN